MQQLEALAKTLGLQIKNSIEKKKVETEKEDKSGKLYQFMQNMAAAGGIKNIKDPLAWQREQSKESYLHGRKKNYQFK